jgi:hypothetical protein
LTLSACGGGTPQNTTTTPLDTPPLRAGMTRGANFTAYSPGGFATAQANTALADLKAQGADEVVFPILWFQDTKTSTQIAPVSDQTPTDDSVIDAVRQAKALGMRTVIAPHIKVQDGTFRGEIAPSDRAAWYASYRTMLEHFASLAQRANADMLVVGSELVSMSKDTDQWRSLISDTRGRFFGKLTYAANWVQEAEQIGFWPQLDAVGIDAYMPLTPDDATPTVDQLQEAWKQWIPRMQAVGTKAGKPVLLTELGYTSRAGTAQAPATEGDGAVDQQAQAYAYAGAFRALGHADWISGILLWDWSAEGRIDPGDYSPQGKQAQAVMRRWFGGVAPSDPTTG